VVRARRACAGQPWPERVHGSEGACLPAVARQCAEATTVLMARATRR
jgi:hypothetical protein